MKPVSAIIYGLVFIFSHLCFAIFLGIDGSGFIIPILTLIFLSAGYFLAKNTKFQKILTALTLLYLLVYIEYALLVPAGIYRIWFQHMGTGNEPKTISLMLQHILNLFLIFEYHILNSEAERKFRSSILLISCFAFFFQPGMITLLVSGFSLLLSGWIVLQEKKHKKFHIKTGIFIFFLALIPTVLCGKLGNNEISGSSLVDALSTSGRIGMSYLFPRFPLITNIPGKGGVYELNSGGRRPILSSKVQFTVSAERGSLLYLKSGARLNFKDNRWSSVKLPEDQKQEMPLPESEASRKIIITLIDEYAPELLYTSDTYLVEFAGKEYFPDSRQNETLKADEPLFKGSQYTLLEKKQDQLSIPDETETRVLTQVPYAINPAIGELAEQLKGKNNEETLRNINKYLNENMQYTLDTKKNEDFLSDFLFESKKGFCLHFATAYIMLARLNDIPARLAFGYIAKIPLSEPGLPEEYYQDYIYSSQGTTAVTGYSAHFWPEVYLPDKGWQIREATPPMRMLRDESSGYADNSNDKQTETLLNVLNLSSGDNIQEDSAKKRINLYPFLLVLLPILVIFFILYKSQKNLWKNFRRLSLAKSLPDPHYSGWSGWADASSRKLPDNKDQLIQISSRIQKKLYSRDQESVRTEIKELKKIISRI